MAKPQEVDPYGYEADLEDGLAATTILGATHEIVQQMQQNILSHMVSDYRSRSLDPSVLIGYAAELSALDAFVKQCEAMRTRGNVAKERMHRNA